jgi:Cytochrome c3
MGRRRLRPRSIRLLGIAGLPAAILLVAVVGGARAEDPSASPSVAPTPSAALPSIAPPSLSVEPAPTESLPPPIPGPPAPTPIAHPPEGDTNQCLACHKVVNERQAYIATSWEESVHGKGGVTCADCHGGDPTSDRMGIAMDRTKGFIGKPSRDQTVGLCGSCHADPERMRSYNLPTDQYAKYWTSVHGQRLLQAEDTQVAICIDCHGSHDIKKASDPTAAVYPLNVPTLCASCHANAAKMEPYGIPTDQYAIYSKSVHGVALLDNADTRAPSCASCHGSHDAKPPQATEVVEVCGKCHTATQDLYMQSRHSELQTAAPKCWTCHGTHDVAQPSEALFFHEPRSAAQYECTTCHDLQTRELRIQLDQFENEADRRCDTCHHPQSDIYAQIEAIDSALAGAEDAYATADAKITEAAGMGMIVEDADVTLSEAKTSLIKAQAAVHTTKLPVISESATEAQKKAGDAEAIAQARLDESTFRREAMVVVVALIMMIVVALLLIRRQVERGTPEEATPGDDA